MELVTVIAFIAAGALVYFAYTGRKVKKLEAAEAEAQKRFDQQVHPRNSRELTAASFEYEKYKSYVQGLRNLIRKQSPAEWNNKSKKLAGRILSETKEISVSQIDAIKISDVRQLTEFFTQRLNELQLAKNAEYPVRKPSLAVSIKPPPAIDQSLIDECFLSVKNLGVTPHQKESFLLKTEALIEHINSSYKIACKYYDKVSEDTRRMLEDEQEKWIHGEKKWFSDITYEIEDAVKILSILNDKDLITEKASVILGSALYPSWIPKEFELKFDNETGILLVEQHFPNIEELSLGKLVEQKNGFVMKPLNQRETKHYAECFYPLLVLKMSIDLASVIKSPSLKMVVFNGWIDHRNKATGKFARAFCASVAAPVEKLLDLDILYADPIAAFAALNGSASRTLEVTPIAPISRISAEDSRYIDNKDVISKLSENENLATMDWEDFEHLCRELFERVFAREGATVKVTQASRDQGVDAVIIDPRPIHGGKTVVQAKRYVNTVDVSAVRDLYGTVNHEGANKGILVTTSHYGPDSYSFIAGKNLELINGSELLHILQEYGYKFRIDIEEAKKIQKESGYMPFKRR